MSIMITSQTAWDRLTGQATFGAALASVDPSLGQAQVAASDTTKLTYYVRFTITSGSAAAFDGKALYQLGGFSFEDQQTVNIGGASSGAGAGRVAFDPLSLTFTQPSLTAQLMKYLASGTAFKEVDVLGYDSRGYLAQDYSFGLVAASDLKIAANSPTTLQLGYGSQSIQTYTTAADGTTTLAQSAAWNRVANASGFSTGSDSSPPAAASAKLVSSQVAAPDTTKLTYYVRFTSYSGTAQPFDGKTLYELSGFSFEDQQALNIGGASGGVGAGKVTFDPLNLNFVQTGLTAQLMKYLASGTAFKEVDVLGYDSMGHLAQNDSFGLVAATDLTISANSPTTLQLEYGSQSIQTYTTAADGTTKLAQSAAWNSLKDVSSFSTAATGSDSSSPAAASTKLDAAQVAASDTTKLTYYVRFTITSGTAAAFDGKALYQLGGFSFEDQQTVNIGGASSGAGAG
ncbi:type VI protein secretion system component Hcp, partial [Rhodoblastus sphagnicola]|uniref:hypothetical protein n=1 Tax=Rhodoblastus sphagnicola TaxID=333368 RepID=UPI00161ACC39